MPKIPPRKCAVAVFFIFANYVALVTTSYGSSASVPALYAQGPTPRAPKASTASLFLPLAMNGSSSPNWGAGWPTLAANPERTSWTPEEVRGNLSVEWFHPIEPFIPTKVQPIAANGKIYVSTSRGLYAFNATNGNLDWVFPTELPLGHSPTIATVNGKSIAYVGGYDRRIYAIDALTGQAEAGYTPYEAGAGFETNPVVVGNTIYLGNRDSYFYALDAVTGALKWKFKTDGPISFSAAYKSGTLYFASDDMHAYAVGTDGTQVWKSAQFPGAGFFSYWPVVFTDKSTGNEYVEFSGSTNYRRGPESYVFMQEGQYFFPECFTSPDCASGKLVGAQSAAPSNDTFWTPGTALIDVSKTNSYYEDYAYRRTQFVLNRLTGQEFTFDSNGNGKQEYAPFTWSGTTYSGDKYPPIVNGVDGIYYQDTLMASDPWILRSDISGWKPGTHTVSRVALAPAFHAVDEPRAFSSGGRLIYWSLGMDREVGAFDVTIPYGQPGRGWLYYGYDLESRVPDYNPMYNDGDNYPPSAGEDRRLYSGKNQSKNGIYGRHDGTQSAPVPYQGRLYTIKGNTLVAWSPTTTAATRLPLATSVSSPSAPLATSAATLQQKLEAEIRKMIAAGHLRPGYSPSSNGDWSGQGNYGSDPKELGEIFDYFQNPSDTVVTLLQALPELSSATQAQVKNYLQNNYGPGAPYDFTKIAHVGWNTGARREFNDIPADAWSKRYASFGKLTTPVCADPVLGNWGCTYWQTFPPYSFYAAWKYAQVFGNAKSIFDSMSTKLNKPPADTYLTQNPYILNLYVAGYQGYLELQQLAYSTKDPDIQKTYGHLLDLRVNGFSKDTPYWSDTLWGMQYASGNYRRSLSVARNFMFLTPELGQYMSQTIQPQVQAAVSEYQYVAPYWFASRFDNTVGEGTINQLYDSPALFQAKAYVLKQPQSELGKWVDVPAFAVGDLFYIQNLVAALNAP